MVMGRVRPSVRAGFKVRFRIKARAMVSLRDRTWARVCLG
jgi:hypothetical protein